MTYRHTPPGFTSMLYVVVVNPFGPHHLPTCPGSVHTFHTSLRGASKTRVARISLSPTSAVLSLAAAMFRLLCDQVGEALEGFAPPLILAAAGVARRRGLPHGQLHLAALVGESHSRQKLMAGEVVQDRGEDDALVLDDLAVHAMERIVLAVGPAHHEAVCTPGAEVHLATGQREPVRAPPFHDVPGVGPQLPHELARRVEDAREDHLAGVPARHEILSCERGKLGEGLEARVRQPDPGLRPFSEQLEAHQGVACVPFVAPSVREPLVRNRLGDLAPVGIPEALVFDVELELEAGDRSEFTEIEGPVLDVVLVCERLPDQRHGGVERALDDERLVLGRQVTFCGHLFSPCVEFQHLVPALQLVQIEVQPVEALLPVVPAQTLGTQAVAGSGRSATSRLSSRSRVACSRAAGLSMPSRKTACSVKIIRVPLFASLSSTVASETDIRHLSRCMS